MEKWLNVLGATAKLHLNEANCGGFRRFGATTPWAPANATGLNCLEPAIDRGRAGTSGRCAGSHSNTHLHYTATSPTLQEKVGYLQPLNKCQSSQIISKRSPVLYAIEAPLQGCCLPRALLVTRRKSHYSHTSSLRNNIYMKHTGNRWVRCCIGARVSVCV